MSATTAPLSAAAESSRALVERASQELLDGDGQMLAAAVQWWELPGQADPSPVAVLGSGPPLLLLHGFDSSFLEFRRLAPLLADHHQLLIPDLFGFGFQPRPSSASQGPEAVLSHLERLLEHLPEHLEQPGRIGLIGASMGGAVAIALARRCPEVFERLLLLAPAGLTGRPMPVPPLLDRLGVAFLSQPSVRRGLCRSAFADPDRDVGPAELQIASYHLQTPGWAEALASFARSGGFAGCGAPLPPLPLKVLWGLNDRILRAPQKRAALALLGDRLQELPDCGHLPHIDQPQQVAATWLNPSGFR